MISKTYYIQPDSDSKTYMMEDLFVKDLNPTQKFLDRPTAPGPSDAKRKAAKAKRKKK